MSQIEIIGAEWFGDPKNAPAKAAAKTDYSWLPGVFEGVGGIFSQWLGPKQKSGSPPAAAPIPWIPILVGGGGLILLVTIIVTKKKK